MTVTRLSILCWTAFAAMSLAFMPLARAINGIHGLPAHLMVAVVVVGLVWWGPFGYGMYLALAAIGNGDRRLLDRGVPGTAVVLSARPSRMMVQSGGFAWQGTRVYRYRLRVSVPGRAAYETVVRTCEDDVREGTRVNVSVARHNRGRVAIDRRRWQNTVRTAEMQAAVEAFSALPPETETDTPPPEPLSPGTERIHRLVELARQHREGILGDAEYAAEKARILKG